MNTTDIRKGDLVKATRRATPEEYAVFRVSTVGAYRTFSVSGYIYEHPEFDFEVLERPIDEELLKGAIDTYREANGSKRVTFDELAPYQQEAYRKNLTAVIEFVRQYDKEHAR